MVDMPICNFRRLNPSRKPPTRIISLVMFTLTGHDNLDRYLEGLHLWVTEYILHFSPDYTITLFVDENLLRHAVVKQALQHRRVHGIAFRCPDFMQGGQFNNLFPTLVRFFPAIAKHNEPLTRCLVHVFDIEPASKDIIEHLRMLELVKEHNKCKPGRQVDFFYNGSGNPRSREYGKNDKGCPYVFAGRLTLFRKFEEALLTKFLEETRAYGKRKWYYGVMQTPFCRGVDEVFTNLYLLPYAISKGFTIAYAENYCITAPFFWWASMIAADAKSMQYLRHVLAIPKSRILTVYALMKRFDEQFYGNRKVSQYAKDVAKRYYLLLHDLVRKRQPWFPLWQMQYVLKHFDGVIAVKRIAVVCTEETTYVYL